MADYCENTLMISGDAAGIKDFRRRLFGPLSHAPTEPMRLVLRARAPESFDELLEEWPRFVGEEIRTVQLDQEGEGAQLRLEFWTEWSPVGDLVKTLALLFPRLDFDYAYCELGQGFAGALRIHQVSFCGSAFAYRDLAAIEQLVSRYYPEQLDWVRDSRAAGLNWEGDFLAEALNLVQPGHTANGELAQELGWPQQAPVWRAEECGS